MEFLYPAQPTDAPFGDVHPLAGTHSSLLPNSATRRLVEFYTFHPTKYNTLARILPAGGETERRGRACGFKKMDIAPL